jgi:hypothetical protein
VNIIEDLANFFPCRVGHIRQNTHLFVACCLPTWSGRQESKKHVKTRQNASYLRKEVLFVPYVLTRCSVGTLSSHHLGNKHRWSAMLFEGLQDVAITFQDQPCQPIRGDLSPGVVDGNATPTDSAQSAQTFPYSILNTTLYGNS